MVLLPMVWKYSKTSMALYLSNFCEFKANSKTLIPESFAPQFSVLFSLVPLGF